MKDLSQLSDLEDIVTLDPEDELRLRLRLAAKMHREIEEARESPLGLYKLIFSDDEGNEVTIKFFHEEWNRMVLENQFNLIEASRGLTKTTFVIAYALWMIGKNPNIRIKWLGPNDGNASKRLRVISTVIQQSELYHAVFPHIHLDKKAPNNASMLNVERDATTPEPTVEAKGVLSSGTGDRCDLLIMDDICDAKNTLLNPALRPAVLNKMLSDWLPTLNPKTGRIVAIFTPWHEEDANAYFKRKTKWAYKLFAHGKPDDPYYSIFPELFPREKLIALHGEEGDLHYARGRLCQAFTKDTVAILPEQLVPYNAAVLTMEKLRQVRVILSVDPASGRDLDKGKLDFIGITVKMFYLADLGEKPAYQVFIPEAYGVKLSTKNQVLLIKHLIRKWKPEAVLVEAEGLSSLHEWLWDEPDINPEIVIPVKTRNIPKGQRLVAVTPFFQPPEGEPTFIYFHPRVIKPNPEAEFINVAGIGEIAIHRELRHQILSFPTEHDDILDSLTQGLTFIRTYYVPDAATGESPGAEVKVEVREVCVSAR